eukprot:6269028-Amphidinium_carterae.1
MASILQLGSRNVLAHLRSLQEGGRVISNKAIPLPVAGTDSYDLSLFCVRSGVTVCKPCHDCAFATRGSIRLQFRILLHRLARVRLTPRF